MRMDNAITTLVGEELEGGVEKYGGTLAAPNGSLYGIPFRARRVAKFNPVDKSMTHIGPDFGDGRKWNGGAMTDSGVIYCPSCDERGILKIDTNTDNVTELDANLLPEPGWWMWISCAVALDGCIYFIPNNARRIMKLDPNNNDAISSVGDEMGNGYTKYSGTCIGIDGCVYGMPDYSNKIVKYDPINDTSSFVGEEAEGVLFKCSGNGVLARDGCIYALALNGRVLKIDTANNNNSHCFVGNIIQSYHVGIVGWGDTILGIDGCMYWPSKKARLTVALKHDPHSNQTSLVGDGIVESEKFLTWYTGGALATDGVIYCIPFSANQVLAIDPLGEFSLETKANMEEHPEELGFLFRINDANANNTDTDTDTDALSNQTNFDCAVTKFGMQKVLEIVQEHMPPANEVCGLYPFMLAASYKESPLWAVYVLLRQVPFLINSNCNSSNNVHCRL